VAHDNDDQPKREEIQMEQEKRKDEGFEVHKPFKRKPRNRKRKRLSKEFPQMRSVSFSRVEPVKFGCDFRMLEVQALRRRLSAQRLTAHLEKELENGRRMLPMEFLQQSQMQDFVREEGRRRIVNIIQNLLTRHQCEAMSRLKDFVEDARRREFALAATFIQAIARSAIAKKYCERKREIKQRQVQAEAEILLERKQANSRACLRIQCAWRVFLAQRAGNKTRCELNSIKRIQTIWRGKRCRDAFIVLQKQEAFRAQCAVRIQSFVRGYRDRRVAKQLEIERLLETTEEKLPDKSFVLEQKFLETGAALKMQEAFRAKRKDAGFSNSSENVAFRAEFASKIQQKFRWFLECKNIKQAQKKVPESFFIMSASDYVVDESASKIQASWKGLQTRRQFRKRVESERLYVEEDLKGKMELELALAHCCDELLLEAFHCDPEQTSRAQSETLARYYELTDSTSTISLSSFLQFCRSTQVLEDQAQSIFSQCVGSSSAAMKYLDFINALELLTLQIFGEPPKDFKLRRLCGLEAKLVQFLGKFVLHNSLREELFQRVQKHASIAAMKMQNLFRSWKERQKAKLKLVALRARQKQMIQEKAALRVQKAFRSMRVRTQLREIVRTTFRCFVDLETGERFWQNPNSGRTTWTKPKILGNLDVVRVIPIPPTRHQLLAICERCNHASIAGHCFDCELSFCRKCLESFHKKGARKSHERVEIDPCSCCEFQVASRLCHQCGDLPLCDSCSGQQHRSGAKLRHRISWLVDEEDAICQSCGLKAARYKHTESPICSFCLEAELQVDSLKCEMEPFVTIEMKKRKVELREARILRHNLEQAQAQEKRRLERVEVAAAIRIQKIWRAKLAQRSKQGQRIARKLLKRQKLAQMQKEEHRGLKGIVQAFVFKKGSKKKRTDNVESDGNGEMEDEDEEEEEEGVTETDEHIQETWERVFDEGCQAFYLHNPVSGECKWEETAAEDWERCFDEQTGAFFWFNKITWETRWERSCK